MKTSSPLVSFHRKFYRIFYERKPSGQEHTAAEMNIKHSWCYVAQGDPPQAENLAGKILYFYL